MPSTIFGKITDPEFVWNTSGPSTEHFKPIQFSLRRCLLENLIYTFPLQLVTFLNAQMESAKKKQKRLLYNNLSGYTNFMEDIDQLSVQMQYISKLLGEKNNLDDLQWFRLQNLLQSSKHCILSGFQIKTPYK